MRAVATTVRPLICLALLSGPTQSGEGLILGSAIVESCRVAAIEGGNAEYANGPAAVSETSSGEPRVSMANGAITCKFAKTGSLVEVFVIGCYECAIMYDDQLIARINLRLLRLRPHTP